MASVDQAVGSVLGVVNLGGRTPLVLPQAETIQTENLSFISYFVPSILGMSVMQLGIFAAVPLVADREKGILKRLAATPLRRSQLVGSNTLMRLLLALLQAVIIVGVGVLVFGVEITGSLLMAAAFIVLGAVAFLSLGYVLASFTKTEDAANGLTQVVQFPMMFLSGVFFPIAAMPPFLQTIARLIPLTYLADALRQVMVGGVPFAPLYVCAPSCSAGWSSASRSPRASSAGSSPRVAPQPAQVRPGRRGLPALLVDELVERDPAARLRRTREVGRVGRVAEREQELAMAVGRIAEEPRARSWS